MGELQALLDAQLGLITQPQLSSFGITTEQTKQKLEYHHWLRVLRGVYSVDTGPLTRERQLVAALLYGNGHAILSHRTAAEEWGWLTPEVDLPIHVTVPYGKSAMNQPQTMITEAKEGSHLIALVGSVLHPGVVVHRSRAYEFIVVSADMPRTNKADTAIDMAVAEPVPRDAFTSLCTSVTNGRIRTLDVRRRLEERAPRRYGKILESAVALLEGGVQSKLELLYATDVEAAHGLPVAVRQLPVEVDGRTLYEDCAYSVNGKIVIVRLDGRRFHAAAEVAFRDRRRDNAAELANRSRLVYGWEDVTRIPCIVAREVFDVLSREGWAGELGRCAACA